MSCWSWSSLKQPREALHLQSFHCNEYLINVIIFMFSPLLTFFIEEGLLIICKYSPLVKPWDMFLRILMPAKLLLLLIKSLWMSNWFGILLRTLVFTCINCLFCWISDIIPILSSHQRPWYFLLVTDLCSVSAQVMQWDVRCY